MPETPAVDAHEALARLRAEYILETGVVDFFDLPNEALAR